jgi:TolB-like protein
MKRKAQYILAAVLICVSGTEASRAGSAGAPEIDAPGVVTIIVLPFADYTADADARARFLPRIDAHLRLSRVRLVTADSLRETLRAYRIRTTGDIRSEDARLLAGASGADYILLGSLDFSAEETAPEAGLSMRLLDPKSMRILWAASDAATGDDFAGLFGIGRISDMNTLADRLVERMAHAFDDALDNISRTSAADSPPSLVALIPFDNLTDQQYAGNIVTQYTLTGMINSGWLVIEPGVVTDAALRLGKVPRGEIDMAMLTYLHDSVGVGLVVTGTVNNFRPGRSEVAAPSVALDARLVRTEDGKILCAVTETRMGGNDGTVFHAGGSNALGRLTGKAVKEMLKKLDKARNEYAASER